MLSYITKYRSHNHEKINDYKKILFSHYYKMLSDNYEIFRSYTQENHQILLFYHTFSPNYEVKDFIFKEILIICHIQDSHLIITKYKIYPCNYEMLSHDYKTEVIITTYIIFNYKMLIIIY